MLNVDMEEGALETILNYFYEDHHSIKIVVRKTTHPRITLDIETTDFAELEEPEENGITRT
jgi:hypothetical protein